MGRPIQAIIHPSALSQNLQLVHRLAPNSRIWAVVKANAYGHGLRRVYPALACADGYALLDLAEAVQLRELGWGGPILLLEGVFTSADLATAERYHLSMTVHCEEQIRMLECGKRSAPLDLHVKMNTGMNRLGFKPEAYLSAWQRLQQLPTIVKLTRMTHFSDADGPRGITHQLAAFERGAGMLAGPRSLCNSAAILWHREAHTEWVRPGIMLYGASPSGRWEDVADTGLQPAMTLRSELIAVQTIQAGDTVGYGSRFIAPHAMRIGVVACGYADGYPRHAEEGTPVWVEGVRTRLIGRVSMDMLTIDVSECPQAHVGSSVELWGKQIPIDAVASASGTVGYELMCALAARVPVIVNA